MLCWSGRAQILHTLPESRPLKLGRAPKRKVISQPLNSRRQAISFREDNFALWQATCNSAKHAMKHCHGPPTPASMSQIWSKDKSWKQPKPHDNIWILVETLLLTNCTLHVHTMILHYTIHNIYIYISLPSFVSQLACLTMSTTVSSATFSRAWRVRKRVPGMPRILRDFIPQDCSCDPWWASMSVEHVKF